MLNPNQYNLCDQNATFDLSLTGLIYWLREFPLSAVANRFELRCQLKQLFFVLQHLALLGESEERCKV